MKLSHLNVFTTLFKLSINQKEKIVFENDMDNGMKYDICLIPGGPAMIPNRANEGIKLYKNNRASKILVTGGIGYLSIARRTPEAIKMYKYLLDKGIKKDDIIIEPSSKDTYQNINKSIDLLKKDYDISKVNIVVATSNYHLKRCLMLLKSVLIKKKVYGIGIEDRISKDNWHKSIKGRMIVNREILLLRRYIRKGIIPEIEIL